MTLIHPTAIVHKKAQIADNVRIGPYSIIGEGVKLSSGVEVMSHVCIEGETYIGENTKIFPFAIVGFPPPDLKYRGEKSRLVIGSNCVLREHVNIHTGTAVDKNQTTIGDNCLLMANVHIAHDCVIGNNVIMANNATLGGHVIVGEFAIIGGLAAILQRVRIGDFAIIGGMSGVVGDVIPFGKVAGDRARLCGLNIIGLKRRNLSSEKIVTLNKAYKKIFKDNYELFEKRVDDVAKEHSNDENIMRIIDFVKQESTMPLCKPGDEEDLDAV